MRKLAAKIRNNLDILTADYVQRLCLVPGYADMSEQGRSVAARSALMVTTAGLERDDPKLLVQFLQAVANERLEQGFGIESMQEALTILAEVLEPYFPTMEASRFLWRTVVLLHTALSKTAVDKLRTTQQQFRYLADNLAVGVFVHQEGILRYAGREGARLLGYDSPDEFIGRSVFDFVHPEDRERVVDIARRRVAGERVPDQYEARLVKKDGSVLEAQIYSALTEYEGQVATQGVFVDISGRLREQERNRQAQESLQTLIDSMPFGVMITARDKRIRHANQAALAAMGYKSEDEVIGLSCHETMCPAEADRCPILDLGQKLDRAERVLVTKDGRHVPILKSAVPVVLGDEEVLLEAFVDVTEKTQLEQQVQESLERRGRQVRTSTEIAQEIATAPVLEDLYAKVVTLVKERFGYYHAQLFLLSKEEDKLVTVAGYGEVGRQLVQEGHSIPMGKGVVGRAGSKGQPILSPDVSQDPEWLYHPLLPETRGELAVPIIFRRVPGRGIQTEEVRALEGDQSPGRVLGVLDVQSDTANLLSDDDRIVLEGLSGQIAIAIESTRLRQEMEEHLRELEYVTRTMSREGWDAYRQRAGSVGYLFDRSDVVAAEELWAPEVDFAADQEMFTLPAADAQSLALAPLKARGGEFIGVLGVQDDPQHPLSAEELALVESVAEQVAQMLESTRLSEETQRRLQELTVLFELSQTLAGAPLQPEEITELIARQFVKVLGVPEASVSLLDPGQDWMRVVADVYADPEEEKIRGAQRQRTFRLVDYPATARVMETLRPLVVQASDPGADPAELAYMQEYGTTTLAIIPMAIKGQVIGVVELESWYQEHRYTPEELKLATTLANQAAVALENARLFAELQMRAEEQRVLNDLARALAACQDVDSVLEEAYRGVSRLMDASNMSVMLFDPDSYQVTLALTAVEGQIESPQTVQPLGGLGLTEYLIRTRKPLLIPEQVRERVEELGLPDIAPSAGRLSVSWLGVPMMIRERVLGTMVVHSYETPRAFDERSQYLLSAVANQAAIALENVQLLENTRAALAEVQSTHRSYLRQAWQEYLRQREMLARSGFVYDRLQAEREEEPVTASDVWRPEMERAVAQGKAVAATGRDGSGERSGLAVPITVRGQTLGVIGVESPSGDRQWTEDEIALIQAVSEELGQALESARLFADTQRGAERERLIGEITAKIRASTDMQAILETTAAELGRVLGTSRAVVRLARAEPEPGRGNPPA